MTLEALAAKYGTDKLEHGYISFYEKHLPKEPKRILEIGVKEGRSLAMWAEYFPNAEIHGLDLFVEFDSGDAVKFACDGDINKINRIMLHYGHQCAYNLLEELRKYDFDVIIDDGSHNSRDQMMTFFGLFNGKHYFIEDLHCCDDEFYSQGLPVLARADQVFNDIMHQGMEYTNGLYVDFNKEGKIMCIYDKQ